MKRITKDPEVRREEIIMAGQKLIIRDGYKKTSVAMIINEINIAKGTFYYYFKSKEDLLDSIVNKMLDDILAQASILEKNEDLTALEKMEMVFSRDNEQNMNADEIGETLHQPENRELHEQLNVQLVNKFAPIISRIVEQGISEGVFKVDRPLESVQFLLVASQFLFDEQLFSWNEDQLKQRRLAMQDSIELTLGAPKNSFKFLTTQ